MNDFDPTTPSLELSQDELKSLHHDLAEIIIRHGEASDNPGVHGFQTGTSAYKFTYPLPAEFVRDTFYPDDESLIVSHHNYITYEAPHRIEDSEDEPIVDVIFLSLETRLAGAPITCYRTIFLRNTAGIYSTSCDTEYIDKEDRRISPDDIPRGTDLGDDEAVIRMVKDVVALEHPLTIDDAEQLRKIRDFIAAS